MQHLDEGTIHAWLDGALPAAEASDVERHVRDCAECAAQVADARGMIAGAARIVSALDDVPAGVIPKQPAAASRSLWRTLRLTPFRAAMAASLMVAAASLAVFRYAPQGDKAEGSRPALAAASAPAPEAVSRRLRGPDSGVAEPHAKKRLEAAPTRARVDLAKAAPAAEPRGIVEQKEKVAAALDSGRRTAAADSLSSRVVDGGARASDTARAASAVSMEAARRSVPAPAAAPAAANVPAGNAIADRAMARRNTDLKLTEVVTTAATASLSDWLMFTSDDGRPLTLPGCYQVVRDSLGARIRLPDRFSLDTALGAQGNVVRGLTPDGRRDSVMAGITWRPAPSGDRFVLISSITRRDAMFAQTPDTRFKPDTASAVGRGGPTAAKVASPRLSRVDCR